MKIGAYIIHLERAHTRKENVKQLLEACPTTAVVHPAIDGSLLTKQQTADIYTREIYKPRYPFRLLPGELGCFLSHREVWKRMIHDRHSIALIIEDDVTIDPTIFTQASRLAKKHCTSMGYIKFPTRLRKSMIRSVEFSGTSHLFEQMVIPLATQCQMVSYDAAMKLLACTEKTDRPIDVLQQLRHITDQRIYTIFPNGITEISAQLDGSTVHGKRKNHSWLYREWNRWIYRHAVRKCSEESF